jgi:hypothetical protein
MINEIQALSFLEQSLTPSVFWGAISAIGTLLAIIVALLFPTCSQYNRNNHIERLLEAEIKGNAEKISQISRENMTLKGGPLNGQMMPALQRNDSLVLHIKLSMWNQFKYELATNRPDSFKKFNDVNDQVELLFFSKTQPDPFRLAVQSSAAENFTLKYNEMFNK